MGMDIDTNGAYVTWMEDPKNLSMAGQAQTLACQTRRVLYFRTATDWALCRQ
ncbi:hypothetical protein Scep_028177 [Stephania cephalantha]|uniref:Uncharacterized protein n=1 Tax=Stephania cephalantha TaxID=152367 RepID=A0AAP0E9D0_9MAGN